MKERSMEQDDVIIQGKEEKNMRNVYELSYKPLLTLNEAASYTGLGVNKLRAISSDENCEFILWNGSKRMFKRKKLEKYLDDKYSI